MLTHPFANGADFLDGRNTIIGNQDAGDGRVTAHASHKLCHRYCGVTVVVINGGAYLGQATALTRIGGSVAPTKKRTETEIVSTCFAAGSC
jgi:hypothetical protein